MEPMTVDEILQWHAEQMRLAHEQEARERIPPLGHDRGAKTKALWNGKAYEIVHIVEPEPDPAQRALDEFIAVRKAKREAPPAPVEHSLDTQRALDRAMHQRLKPYRGA